MTRAGVRLESRGGKNMNSQCPLFHSGRSFSLVLQAIHLLLAFYLQFQLFLRGHVELIFRLEEMIIIVEHRIACYIFICLRAKQDADGGVAA